MNADLCEDVGLVVRIEQVGGKANTRRTEALSAVNEAVFKGSQWERGIIRSALI